jgi:hypothetical protein
MEQDKKFMPGVLRIVANSRVARNYYFAENRIEAAEIINLRSVKLKAVGAGNVGCIIFNVVMREINGNLLLHWIRRSEHSPDLFLLVVMISAVVNHRCLTTAWDAGENEFVAEQFFHRLSSSSAFRNSSRAQDSLSSRPPNNVPNRRRSRDYLEEARRKLTEADYGIVYPGKDPGKFRRDKPPVRLFRMPNRLKEKLFGRDFHLDADGGLAGKDILEAAKSYITEYGGRFTHEVKDSITDFVNAHEEVQASFGQVVEQMKISMEKINLLARELRGQGGVAGYLLILELGKSLYNCTRASVIENLLKFVKTYIGGNTAIINFIMKKEMLKSLEAAKKKYSGGLAKSP